MCDIDGSPIENYFGRGECGKGQKWAAGKDKITGEMIKGGDNKVDWIRSLCNTAFESGFCLKTGDLL